MEKYPLIRSTLEGIFGSQVASDDATSVTALRRDLQHEPFRQGIKKELAEAFSDKDLSWRELLEECDVASFDSEQEARQFATERVLKIVNEAT